MVLRSRIQPPERGLAHAGRRGDAVPGHIRKADPLSRRLARFCPTQALDRARRFEQTLVQAWAKRHGNDDNPFDKPLTKLWSPTSDVPALFLNTTEVETGERVVLAPFSLQQEIPTLNALIDRDPELDIKLSTASGLSARFPGLTAPGWYRIKTEDGEESFKRRLVDGGYFENSGVATAFDLLTSLEKALSARHQSDVELILVSVKRADSKGLSSEPPHGFHEIMTPLRTLNNTRAARGKLALDQASLALDGAVCRDWASPPRLRKRRKSRPASTPGGYASPSLKTMRNSRFPWAGCCPIYRRERSRTASDGHRIVRRTGRN